MFTLLAECQTVSPELTPAHYGSFIIEPGNETSPQILASYLVAPPKMGRNESPEERKRRRADERELQRRSDERNGIVHRPPGAAPFDGQRRRMKWKEHGGSWIEDPTAQPEPYTHRDTGSGSVRAGGRFVRFSVPPLPPSRAIQMSSVRVGMKEAPRGGGVPAEHVSIVMCAEEEYVPAALHAPAPAVSRDPVVWESPAPRVVEPAPDLYSIDTTLRRHGMYHGANMMTDHENAMHNAVGRLRRWSI